MLVAAAILTILSAAPVKVEVRQVGTGWQLLRNGRPYYIKGVGGSSRLTDLKAFGGNSMRSWGSDGATKSLDEAQRLGLTFTLGIWLGHKSYFDYSSADQLARQKEQVVKAVETNRNHPALLLWGLGNEMEEGGNDTPTLWAAIEDLAKTTKSLDANHPVMTVVAEVSPEKIANIKRYAPSIDILGVNSYGGLATLPERLRRFGWTKPYVVTEFGPLGPWERPKTAWGAALEPTSTEKADLYLSNYRKSIRSQPQCLGSYAFLWGDKQEETPTWFGMFLPNGERTAAVDAMSYAWTGKWPAKRSPRIDKFVASLAGREVSPNSEATAEVVTSGSGLRYRWSMSREVADKRYAGEGEQRPGPVQGFGDDLHSPRIRFTSPARPGAYRLYVTVVDGHGAAACANAPFLVRR